MDIQKLVEEELKKMLKEAQVVVVGSLTNPLEFSQFKNWEERQLPKVRNADVYYFNSVNGQKTKEDKVFLAHYLNAEWSGITDDTGKTRKDIKPKLINVNTPQNLALAQAIRNEIAAQLEDYTEKVKRVGDIQKYVDALRAAIPEKFPNKQKYPNLTKRLKAILEFLKINSTDGKGGVDRVRVAKVLQKFVTQTQSKPVVKPTEQTAQPVPAAPAAPATPAAAESPGLGLPNSQQAQNIVKELPDAAIAEATRMGSTPQQLLQKGLVWDKKKNKWVESSLYGPEMPKEIPESKLIRKMIIQEVYKTLRK